MAGHPLRSATDRRLGGPLPHQLANQTRTHPFAGRSPFTTKPCDSVVPCGISICFQMLFPSKGQIIHALRTRPPLGIPGASSPYTPFDLHVLSTPPAFVLSQDQTLPFNPFSQGSPLDFPGPSPVFGLSPLWLLPPRVSSYSQVFSLLRPGPPPVSFRIDCLLSSLPCIVFKVRSHLLWQFPAAKVLR